MNYLCIMHYSTNRLRDVKNAMLRKLRESYPPEEAGSMVNQLIFQFMGLTRAEQQLRGESLLSESQIVRFHKALQRLLAGEPLQYVLGHTEFYGLDLEVGPEVLIPRPETEELVERVLAAHPEPECRVLDMGTGSGCIALALKSMRKNWDIMAVDISLPALALARRNSEKHALAVDFRNCDILSPAECLDKTGKPFHIIVSNPPYVRKSERKFMAKNVLDFEPETALFVEDRDPLLYYREMATFARRALVAGGAIYWEVNENLAGETAALLREMFFVDVEIFNDIRGKQRFVGAKKP